MLCGHWTVREHTKLFGYGCGVSNNHSELILLYSKTQLSAKFRITGLNVKKFWITFEEFSNTFTVGSYRDRNDTWVRSRVLTCATDMLKTILLIKVVIFKFITWCLIKIVNTLKGEKKNLFDCLFLSFEPFSLLNLNKLILAQHHKTICRCLRKTLVREIGIQGQAIYSA